MQKEDQLDEVQKRLAGEQQQRLAAEAYRDQLIQHQEALEARLVESTQVQVDANVLVQEMDRKADAIAERLAAGEISEEEAVQAEEELMRAQARQLEARNGQLQEEGELQQVQERAIEAERRLEAAGRDESRLQEQLEEMRAEVERTRAERDSEQKRREDADSRFQMLYQRLQSRVAAKVANSDPLG